MIFFRYNIVQLMQNDAREVFENYRVKIKWSLYHYIII